MKEIRIGIFGMGRGKDNIRPIQVNGGVIVAICDRRQERLDEARALIGGDVACYTDFDEFIRHPMDAVYLCNYFNEHVPYAIKALERNIHVISECIPNSTMAEGVALVRAAEKSRAMYFLAENYPYMPMNLEMKRVYEGGTLGKVEFAEGEYNHPVARTDYDFLRRYYDGPRHWRACNPATYYLTHSLGPLLCATKARPVRVTALPIYKPERAHQESAISRCGDREAIMLTLNDDGSVFRITGCARFGAHENSYRLACGKGQIENRRGTDGEILLRYSSWEVPEGMQEENCYFPHQSPEDEALAAAAGHGGGDYYMFKDFFTCIREGKRPFLDEYTATTMASVGILGHRSVLEMGTPYDIPDFRREEDRKKYENDTLSPYFGPHGEAPTLPSCSHPEYEPYPEDVVAFEELLKGKD